MMVHGAVIAASHSLGIQLWSHPGHPRASWHVRPSRADMCRYTLYNDNVAGRSRCCTKSRRDGKDGEVTSPPVWLKEQTSKTLVLMEEWKRRVAIGITVSSLLVLSPAVFMAGSVVPALIAPDAAHAVTNEQLLYLEAWRAVDRAYVDKTFNGQSWFKVREDTLKKKKLVTREDTYAEIKSMLASLNDPFTRFLEPEQYKALRGTTSGGDVTGVGLEVSFSPGAVSYTHLRAHET